MSDDLGGNGCLTSRESEIIDLVGRGFTQKEVAGHLGISAGTVKIHLQNVFVKLRARSSAHAVFLRVSETQNSKPKT